MNINTVQVPDKEYAAHSLSQPLCPHLHISIVFEVEETDLVRLPFSISILHQHSNKYYVATSFRLAEASYIASLCNFNDKMLRLIGNYMVLALRRNGWGWLFKQYRKIVLKDSTFNLREIK